MVEKKPNIPECNKFVVHWIKIIKWHRKLWKEKHEPAYLFLLIGRHIHSVNSTSVLRCLTCTSHTKQEVTGPKDQRFVFLWTCWTVSCTCETGNSGIKVKQVYCTLSQEASAQLFELNKVCLCDQFEVWI